MAYISESTPAVYPEGVYQIEDGDPASGGPTGTFVVPLRALAERTKYLKGQVEALDAAKAPLASPALTGVPTAPTAAPGTNSTQVATCAHVAAAGTAALATADPLMDGAAAVGTAARLAREDHRHPTDTTRAPLASPALTGVPTAPTAPPGTDSTQIATCAHVAAAVAGGAIAPGTETTPGKLELATAAETLTGTDASRAVHPAGLKGALDHKAPLASPALTGVPTAPTAEVGTSTTQLATTAYVLNANASSKNASGYTRLPNGVIIQWMSVTESVNISDYKTFPIAFPNAVFAATGAPTYVASGGGISVRGITNSSIAFYYGDGASTPPSLGTLIIIGH